MHNAIAVSSITNLVVSEFFTEGALNICRASKLKDHKIGRSPYLLKSKSGDFLQELFRVEKQSATAAIM